MARRWTTALLAGAVCAVFIATGVTSSAVAAPVDPGPACTTNADALTPVVCLPADSGEDESAPIGTGQTVTFGAQIVNNGPDVADATVVITLPTGLRVSSGDPIVRFEQWWTDDFDGEGGIALTCVLSNAGATITCATGALAQGANIIVAIPLTAQSDAPVGSSDSFTVALSSAPAQTVFPSTQVEATVDFTGAAHLQVVLTPARVKVTVGKSSTLIATVHNAGPNPAANTIAFGLSMAEDDNDSHFVITNSAEFGSGDQAAANVKINAASRAQPAAAAPAPFGYWPVGTIASGATATVTITVRAESAGTDDLTLEAGSDAADAQCDEPDPPVCESVAIAQLIGVAPIVVTPTVTATTTVTVTKTAVAGPELAATGADTTPLLGMGFAALLMGSGLMVAGRSERRSPARHR